MFDLKTLMIANPVAIRQEDSISHAVRVMLENHCVCLPVINQHRKLVGVITEKMLIKWLANAKNSSEPVSKCVKTNIIPLEQNTGMIVVVYRFIREELRELPVTMNAKLVGIVKRSDVIRHIIHLKNQTQVSA